MIERNATTNVNMGLAAKIHESHQQFIYVRAHSPQRLSDLDLSFSTSRWAAESKRRKTDAFSS